MAKFEMGPGFKVLTYFVVLAITVGISFYVGKSYEKGTQVESNIEVLSIDSEVGQEIAKETAVQKVETNEQIENLKDPIADSNGYMSHEFMLIMESAKSNAERRGNKAGIIHGLTKP